MSRTTPLDSPLISTFGRLLEASNALERRLGRELEQQTGVPLTWFEVLLRLGRSPGGQLSMGALADQVALTSGGVTRLLDRMISAGYVERVPCPTDRRVSYASLSALGRRILQQATAVHLDLLGETFAGFSAAELATLDALLDRLRRPPS